MQLSDELLTAFDRLVSQPKRIMGKVAWSSDDRPVPAQAFRASLSTAGDEDFPLFLYGRAASSGMRQWVVLTLTINDTTLDRLSYKPTRSHANGAAPWSPRELYFLRFPAGMSRRYSWSDNRVYPHNFRNEMAREIAENIDTAQLAIAYMLNELLIEGHVPTPEYQATLGL